MVLIAPLFHSPNSPWFEGFNGLSLTNPETCKDLVHCHGALAFSELLVMKERGSQDG